MWKQWPDRSGRSVSSRPFCLGWVLLLILMAGCGPLRQPHRPQLSVEVVEDGLPVQGENQLGVHIFSTSARSRLLVAYLELKGPSGVGLRSEHRLQVPGGVTSRFDLEYRAQEAGVHRLALRFYDLERGVLVHAEEDLRLVVRPRWEFTQDRSYYTDEDQFRFRARLNRADEIGKRVAVELRGNGTVAGAVDLGFHLGQVEGAFAAGALPEDGYELVARLYGGSGIEDSLSVEFDKLPSADREVKIDLFSQVLLIDGEPFFPIGLYWLRAGLLSEVKRLGFNVGDYYYKLQGEEIAELMDAADREGMQILLELSDFIRRREVPDFEGIEKTVERYRRHPALLAWYLIDEPTETSVKPELSRKIYERIRELDPYHPVYLVNNRPQAYADYIDASDILAIDVYPVPRYPLTRVREFTQEARWCSLRQKPVWLVAQAFGGVEHWPRPPTAAELRNMVYQALVQGARGILFYRYCQEEERQIQPSALWREVRTLAAELTELTPVLVAPEKRNGVRIIGGSQGVDAMLREYEGAYYLFTVNFTRSSRRVRLRFGGLPPLSYVEALFRSRQPRLQNGALEADIEPLGVGIYRLETTGI